MEHKFLKKLSPSLLYNDVHFLFLFVILFILSLRYWYLFILLFFYTLFLLKKTSLKPFLVLLSCLVLVSTLQYLIPPLENQPIFGIIWEKDDSKYILLTTRGKTLLYAKDDYSLGDYGYFTGDKVTYDTSLFSYSDYLLNQNIYSAYKVRSFERKGHFFVLPELQFYALKLMEKNLPKTYPYVASFVFGVSSLKETTLYASRKLGISHLLAISGMHVALLVMLIEKVLSKLFYFGRTKNILLYLILGFYLILTNFQLTVLRAILMVIFMRIVKEKDLLFTRLDVLSFLGVLLLVIHPRYLFLLSFQLSFMVSFMMITFISMLSVKNRLLRLYLITLVAFLTSFPLVLQSNYQINLLTLIVGPIFSLLFEFVIFPMALSLVILPILDPFLCYFFEFFDKFALDMAKIDSLTLVFGKLSILSIILYYVILYFLFVRFYSKSGRKFALSIFILFVTFLYARPYFNPFFTVRVLDVSQGDSILITLPNAQKVILIDCYYNADDYLAAYGIKHIDFVFLTHGHSDHIGAYEELANRYKIDKTITSALDTTQDLKELIKKYPIERKSAGTKYSYDKLSISILGPLSHNENENNNSLVLKLQYDKCRYLFTGDMEKEEEAELISFYGNALETDVLKAGHHGSNTSSSSNFLSVVRPKKVLISVGINNAYGLPNNENLLKNYSIYRTDKDGTITLFQDKNRITIKKYFSFHFLL